MAASGLITRRKTQPPGNSAEEILRWPSSGSFLPLSASTHTQRPGGPGERTVGLPFPGARPPVTSHARQSTHPSPWPHGRAWPGVELRLCPHVLLPFLPAPSRHCPELLLTTPSTPFPRGFVMHGSLCVASMVSLLPQMSAQMSPARGRPRIVPGPLACFMFLHST